MDKFDISDIIRIQDAIQDDNLVLFVGAGVSKNSGVPLWGEILNLLREMMSYDPIGISNNLQLAEVAKKDLGEEKYNNILSQIINADYQPNIIHSLIFALRPKHIITTNYDTLLEQVAQEQLDRDFHINSADADFCRADNIHMLIKMHGDFGNGNITFSSTDYRQYSELKPLMENVVKSTIATNVVLMVGVSFEDDHLQEIAGYIYDKSENRDLPLYVLLPNIDRGKAEFYKSLGAKILWIPEQYINPYNVEYKWLLDYSTLKDPVGIELYKQLRFIRDYKRNIDVETLPELTGHWNIIGYLYEQIKPVAEHIPYLYEFIKYLWEENFRNGFSYNINSIFVDSKYIRQLSDNFNTIGAKRRLLQNKHAEISYLRDFAILNNIYQIDHLPLFSSASWQRRHRIHKHSDSIVDKFFNFEFQNITNEDIESLTGTSNDLLLPYVYYLNDKYAEAIYLYEQIYEKCKKNNKILALICHICIYNLRNPAYWQLQRRLSSGDLDTFKRKYDAIDIQKEIHNLKIPEGLKRIFADITNYSINLTGLRDSSKLLTEIIHDRKIAANGGYSSNSHADQLECLLFNDIAFYINNCIVGDNNSYATQARFNAIAGLLVSHNIEQKHIDSKHYRSSKKEKISRLETITMLFMIRHSSLQNIIRTFDIRRIIFDDDAIQYINSILTNMSKFGVNADIYETPLLNLLELMCLSNNYFEGDKCDLLLNSLANNTALLQNHSSYQLIHKAIRHQKMSLHQASRLLCAIRTSRRIYTGMSEVVKDIAIVYAKHRTVCLEINSLSDMNYDTTKNITLDELEYIANYYPIVKPSVKKQIITELRLKVYHWPDMMYAIANIAYSGIPVFNKQLLSSYLDYLHNHDIDNPMHTHLFLVLLKVYSTTRSSEMKKMIDEYINTCEFLQFIRNPLVYPKKRIKPMWITWCKPNKAQLLFNDKFVRRRILDYIKTDIDYRVEILKNNLVLT